jgi:hypothetical protein
MMRVDTDKRATDQDERRRAWFRLRSGLIECRRTNAGTENPQHQKVQTGALMKTKNLACALAFAAGFAAAGAAQAAGKIYIGGVAGLVDYDAPGFDRAINAGVYGGYNLLGRDSHWNADLKGGTLAAEGQVTLSAAKGDAGALGDWDMTSIAVYAAYRHAFTDYFYLKAKLGVVNYDIDTDIPPGAGSGIDVGKETALSAGIGAGFKTGPGNIEVEVTTHESDVLFVSGGFHISF